MKKRAIPFRELFLLDVNQVVRFLILSDFVLYGAWGLLGPIFAIFVIQTIPGADVAVVGLAATVFLITKSIVQIPVASFVDRIRGEKDDFHLLFLGSLVAAVIPILYLFINSIWELYFVQFVFGLSAAAAYPSYMAIFTRHIDKNKEGTEWGVYQTLVDVGSALTAAIGGLVALTIGFRALIVTVVVISVIGSLLLYPIRPYLKKK